MTMAVSTGLIGLVAVTNSARPPLAASQVLAMAINTEGARPGRQAASAPRPPRMRRCGSGMFGVLESNTHACAPGLLESARPA